MFDIQKNEGVVKRISTQNTGFVDLAYENGMYYLLAENGIIHLLDSEFNDVRRIQIHLENTRWGRYPFRYINIYLNQIILLPMYCKSMIKIDLQKHRSKEIDVSKYFYGTGRYYVQNNKNKIIVFQSENTNGCQIDIENEIIDLFLNLEQKESTLKYFIHRVIG